MGTLKSLFIDLHRVYNQVDELAPVDLACGQLDACLTIYF